MTSLSLCSGAGLVCFLQSQKIKCNVATNLPPAVPEPGPSYLPFPGAPRESHPGTPRESHPGASQATAGLGCPRKGSERNTTSQPPPLLFGCPRTSPAAAIGTNPAPSAPARPVSLELGSSPCQDHPGCSQAQNQAPGWEPGSLSCRGAHPAPLLSSPSNFLSIQVLEKINQTKAKAAKLKLVCRI